MDFHWAILHMAILWILKHEFEICLISYSARRHQFSTMAPLMAYSVLAFILRSEKFKKKLWILGEMGLGI